MCMRFDDLMSCFSLSQRLSGEEARACCNSVCYELGILVLELQLKSACQYIFQCCLVLIKPCPCVQSDCGLVQ